MKRILAGSLVAGIVIALFMALPHSYKTKPLVITGRSSEISVLSTVTWSATGAAETHFTASAIGDVDNDGKLELVAVGYTVSGGYGRQLITIWERNGDSWAIEYSGSPMDGNLTDVAIANIESAISFREIVMVGRLNNSGALRPTLMIAHWNGTNLNYTYWYGSTESVFFSSLALGNTDSDAATEIVVGGWNNTLLAINATVVVFNYTATNGIVEQCRYNWQENLLGYSFSFLYLNGIDVSDSNIYTAGHGLVVGHHVNFVRKLEANDSAITKSDGRTWLTDNGDILDMKVENYIYAGGKDGTYGQIWALDRNDVMIRHILPSMRNMSISGVFVGDADMDTVQEAVVCMYNSTLNGLEVWNTGEYQLESNITWSFSGHLSNTTDISVIPPKAVVIGDISNGSVYIATFDLQDHTPPVVEIYSPSNGDSVSGKVRIEVNATDKDSAIKKVQFFINGILIGEVNSTPYSYEWDTTMYSPGEYNITVVAYDIVNNTGKDTVFVNVTDTVPPEIEILSPVEGNNYTHETCIVANVSDGSGLHKIQVVIDGHQYYEVSPGGAVFYHLNISWDPQQFSNGMHVISLVAVDNSDLQHSVSVSVNVIDITPPTVRFITPQNNDIVSGVVRISVEATDASGIANEAIYINGTPLIVHDGSATWNTSLYGYGTYNLTYVAIDNAGLVNSTTVFVILQDAMGPTLLSVSPKDRMVKGTATLELTVYDPAGIESVELYIGDRLIARLHEPTEILPNGSAVYRVTFDTAEFMNGIHDATMVMIDKYGNTNVETFELTINNDFITILGWILFKKYITVTLVVFVALAIMGVLLTLLIREWRFKNAVNSLRMIMIIHNETGLPLLTAYFRILGQPPELISGMISALSSFSGELGGKEIKTMEWEGLVIIGSKGHYVTAIMIASREPPRLLKKRLSKLVDRFEKKYRKELEQFTGEIDLYKDFISEIRKEFGECYVEEEYIVEEIKAKFFKLQQDAAYLEQAYVSGKISETEYKKRAQEVANQIKKLQSELEKYSR